MKKIKELRFSDLMILYDGRCFFRHVEGWEGPLTLSPKEFEQDLDELKSILNKKQEREFFLQYDDVPYRVAKVKTLNGCGYFLRRPAYPVPEFCDLGFKLKAQDALLKLGRMHGMILFSGATGSGKSTSIYSLIQLYLNQYGDIAVAIEDPPELPAQGSYGKNDKGLWYQIDANDAGGYEGAMVSAMRYNPRYIVLGEIRTPAAANEAIRAAVNGHVVLTTIHGSSVSGAILALQQLAAAHTGSQELARSILADGLLAVVHQKLENGKAFGRRRLNAETLFLGEGEHGIRSKIRNGKLELISSDIEFQKNQIDNGKNIL